MVCYHPLQAIYPFDVDSEGKRRLIFSPSIADDLMLSCDDSPVVRDISDKSIIKGFKINIPCGKCIGCKLDYSRDYAVRSYHELHMLRELYGVQKASFLTLTFSDDALLYRDKGRSLDKLAFRQWIKRFRQQVYRYYGIDNIKIMACGEYGKKFMRPHYHMIIYGFDFPDKYRFMMRNNNIYYRSPFVESLWKSPGFDGQYGWCVIGEATLESSAYVARYITGKFDGSFAIDKYKDKEKEFLLTPRKEGLGLSYLKKYYKDIFNHGCIRYSDKFAPIPRYYKNRLKDLDFEFYEQYRIDKFKEMINNLYVDNLDSTRERLLVREEVKSINYENLVRSYEFDSNLHNIY